LVDRVVAGSADEAAAAIESRGEIRKLIPVRRYEVA
jgi:hypothetical protein